MTPLQMEVLQAAQQGVAQLRQQARVQYHLRKRDMKLSWMQGGYIAVDRLTTLCRFGPSDLGRVEVWARSTQRLCDGEGAQQ